ncbi:pre-mRNA-splicing factor spp2 [Metarhizium rileyi]|uniref:Pre-mRNA-splicing factor n=1 Tax=Metarhizium rileyi (strain RCEF 4871) TaxID=1649241 RepID=A0A167A4Q6_METRR|nr:pre-mRNA-splicing factor spp2 [Metarhizium rileyi RCEF 4871]
MWIAVAASRSMGNIESKSNHQHQLAVRFISAMPEPPKGRIAIKLGSTSSTSSYNRNARPKPPSSLGKRPRLHATLCAESDSESDVDDRGQHEAITGFGADGAESRHKRRAEVKKEYVIERQANRDWRGEIRAQRRNDQPAETQRQHDQQNTGAESASSEQEKGSTWGLTLKQKKDQLPTEEPESPNEKPKPKTADDEALDALLGNKPEVKKVITTEDDVYKRDAATAGAASSLEDYEAMPVEEFGAALLRGMGWDGEHRGPKSKDVRKRQNRLGLGAKELQGSEDLGGWNQKGDKKRSRPRLHEYNREQSRRKEERGKEDSYKREREREKDRERNGYRERDADREGRHRHRDRDRYRDYDGDRRR